MSITLSRLRAVLVLGAAFAAMSVARSALAVQTAVEFSGETTGMPTSDTTAGWSFTTNQAITVTALEVFDPTGAGGVRLYDASQTILASATVTTGDPQVGSPTLFYSHAITPVPLAAGTTYFIAEDTAFNTTNAAFFVTGMTVDPAITYGGEISATNTGQTPTSDLFGGVLNPGIFGPNFAFTTAAAPAPEPLTATLGLLSVGGLAMATLRRRGVRL